LVKLKIEYDIELHEPNDVPNKFEYIDNCQEGQPFGYRCYMFVLRDLGDNKVVQVGISPMIWRRLQVASAGTITDLQYVLQTAMGWPDDHLNRFRIRGIQYGVYHDGGMGFSHDPDEVRVGDYQFRINEKFPHEYDVTDQWRHRIRVGNILKQQMRWSQKGAHPLLQIRTRVLNGELRGEFNRWYPGFDNQEEAHQLAAQLPRFFGSPSRGDQKKYRPHTSGRKASAFSPYSAPLGPTGIPTRRFSSRLVIGVQVTPGWRLKLPS
jgi:hypothetical protein